MESTQFRESKIQCCIVMSFHRLSQSLIFDDYQQFKHWLMMFQHQIRSINIVSKCHNLIDIFQYVNLSICHKFICRHNQLTYLPSLPKCEWLICNDNCLEILPYLPNCRKIICYNNHLINIPPLPNCRFLLCQYNNLTQLPHTPKCHVLYCHNNKLSHLPQLNKCHTIYCHNNSLLDLPLLPECKALLCHHNLLSYLPHLPNVNIMSCHHNQELYYSSSYAMRFKLPHPSPKIRNNVNTRLIKRIVKIIYMFKKFRLYKLIRSHRDVPNLDVCNLMVNLSFH
jgi:hypothetical protein